MLGKGKAYAEATGLTDEETAESADDYLSDHER